MSISDKTLLEQAQMLSDFIRSQNTDKPQDSNVVGEVFLSQDIRSSRDYMRELLSSKNIKHNLGNKEGHINSSALSQISDDYFNNRESDAHMALDILTELLKHDGKDLSALDGGKEKHGKTHSEIYKELYSIADKDFVESLKTKAEEAKARINKQADDIKEVNHIRHEGVIAGVDILTSRTPIADIMTQNEKPLDKLENIGASDKHIPPSSTAESIRNVVRRMEQSERGSKRT